MTRSLAAAVLAAALAVACGDDTPTTPTPVTPPTTTAPTVTGVTLQAPAAFVDGGQVLMVGESVTLEACATFSDDTERCGVNATWSSSSPNVATVSATGVVTGAAPGETTISAVYERNTGRATVTVEAVDEGPWDVSGEVTDAETGQGIRRAVILVLNGPHEGNEARTGARGRYVLTDVAGNMNVSITADGYREQRTRFNVRADLVRDFQLEALPPPPWNYSGTGPDAFSIPDRVFRFRITAEYNGGSENFVVWCGTAANRGGLLVNEILGTSSIAIGRTYRGVHVNERSYGGSGQTCGRLQVEHAVGVRWSMVSLNDGSGVMPKVAPVGSPVDDNLRAIRKRNLVLQER